jgi:hypothetical protein
MEIHGIWYSFESWGFRPGNLSVVYVKTLLSCVGCADNSNKAYHI